MLLSTSKVAGRVDRGVLIARSCILLGLACALAGSLSAQFVQQGGKLVATDAVGDAFQGLSVAVSSDGNTAIVGGPQDNNEAGAAWVFMRFAGMWTQQGGKLVGAGAGWAAGQGFSVSLSADGNTAIVGGPFDNDGAGAAWVFTRSGGAWTQQGSKLVGTGATSYAWQGAAVAVSADGNTAIVGGPHDNNEAGAAWVFTRSGDVWTQQGSKLVGTGATGLIGVQQGSSVSLSADGNTAIVGGPRDNGSCGGPCTYVGAAWVYTRSGGVWTQQGSTLVGGGAIGNASQGTAVALSADGNTAIVGGPGDNNGAGAAWVYTRSGGEWSQHKLVGWGAVGGAEQGSSVSLSADGNTALVGGPYDDTSYTSDGSSSTGAAWVFTHSGGTWTQGGKLIGTGANGAFQGISVALSADGDTAIVGGPVGGGAAWVFVVPATHAPAPTVGTVAATSITGVSATLEGIANPNGSDTRVWFLYSTDSSLSGAVSTPQQELGSSTGAVPMNANIAGLSATTTYYFQAWAQSSVATVQGSILRFPTTTSPPSVTTSAVASITNSGVTVGGSVNPNALEAYAWFLYSTNSSLSGALSTAPQDIGSGTLAVPASANIAGLSANTTYYFQAIAQNADGTAQGQILNFTTAVSAQEGSKLVGTGAAGASQGSSVALSADGSTAIVGGPSDNGGIGAAWVYTRSGGMWTQQGGKLVGGGTSVALSSDGNTALVGGCGGTAGVACVYARSGGMWTQESILPAGTGAVGNAAQGASVALSADGNTALVGGPRDDGSCGGGTCTYVGAVWVYTRSGGVWTQQGGKLVGAGAVNGAGQGYSVALSGDGNTALVGGPYDNQVCVPDCAPIQPPYCTSTGAAWVFTRSGDAWTQQGGKLVPSGVAAVAVIGSAVALSGDGNTAIVGGAGAAWVFTRSGSAWFQQGSELVGGAVLAAQRASVALSADGNTAVVGGPGDNATCVLSIGIGACSAELICVSAGAVWVFTRSAGVWAQLGDKLVGAGGVNAAQGSSVALSADGGTLIVGGPHDGGDLPGSGLSGNGITGAAWVFDVPDLAPVAASTITAVVNGASFSGPAAPGSIATLLGTIPVSGNTSAPAVLPLPTLLAGVSVTVNGTAVPLWFVSPGQINFQMPAEVAPGAGSASVTLNGGSSAPFSFAIPQAAPGIFIYNGNRAIADNNPAGTLTDSNNPAPPGSVITVYLTGIGPVDQPVATNTASPLSPPAQATLPFSATIGGQAASVQFLGLTPGSLALAQANIVVPNLAPGDYPVVITVGGAASNAALITVAAGQ